ncbi:MAG: hypothetical protein J3Q66DRAFT_359901 [Benniella sp.]|nr:MAG: hypothetical protein J3Q66DRAFT_359901 [Benniella sp.]
MENTTPPQDTVGTSASSPPKKTLTSMPTEVLMAIALALPCKDFASVLQTCRTIHSVLNTHYIWHQRFITRFGQTALLQQLNSSNKDEAAAASSASSSGASSRASTAPSSPRFPPNSTLGVGSSSGATGSGYGNILPLPYIEHYHNHQDPNSTTSSPQLLSSGAPSPSPSGYSSPHSEHAGSGSGASSENDEGNDNTSDDAKDKDKDKEDGNAKSRAKGKGRKVDLRKTNKASKELLIELYKQYSRMTLPAEDMLICHMGDRYWRMIDSENSKFGRLAQLQSVWWMDVIAIFKGVPPGRYKVQWRLKVTSDAPIINTDFKATLFGKDEDQSVAEEPPHAIVLCPRTIQEFIEHTDSQTLKANRKPFRKVFRDFTILELPGELIIENESQNVYLKIHNQEGWKSGLFVDFARLVDMDDPQKTHLLLTSDVQSDRAAALEEEPNDEGEEYYPGTYTGGLHPLPRVIGSRGNHGFNLGTGILPPIFRTRGVRQFQPVDSSVELDVGARETDASQDGGSGSTERPNIW